MKKLNPKFKLWLNGKQAQGVFGDGKWRLLKAIDDQGSLKAACQSLKISYRKAWGDLKKAEQCLNISLIDKQRGGAAGGKTRLTPQGKKWLNAYCRFRTQVKKNVQKAYENHIESLKR